MAGQDKRDSQRVPVALRIKLRFRKVDTFVSKFATNISTHGMFISSRQPKEKGTQLRFELRLADDRAVIAGRGVVTWVREFKEESPKEPHGMGIEFIGLSKDSRDLISRMVALRIDQGLGDEGIPFEVVEAEANVRVEAAHSNEAKSEPKRKTSKRKAKRKASKRKGSKTKQPPVASAERSSAERSSAERSSAERSSAERSSEERSSAERSSEERSSEELSVDQLLDHNVDMRAVMRRARGIVGNQAPDTELARLARVSAAPVAETVDVASHELARILGGAAIVSRGVDQQDPPTDYGAFEDETVEAKGSAVETGAVETAAVDVETGAIESEMVDDATGATGVVESEVIDVETGAIESETIDVEAGAEVDELEELVHDLENVPDLVEVGEPTSPYEERAPSLQEELDAEVAASALEGHSYKADDADALPMMEDEDSNPIPVASAPEHEAESIGHAFGEETDEPDFEMLEETAAGDDFAYADEETKPGDPLPIDQAFLHNRAPTRRAETELQDLGSYDELAAEQEFASAPDASTRMQGNPLDDLLGELESEVAHDVDQDDGFAVLDELEDLETGNFEALEQSSNTRSAPATAGLDAALASFGDAVEDDDDIEIDVGESY